MATTRPYPIILAHGIARFDFLTESLRQRVNLTLWDQREVFDRLHYFRGIVSYLQARGFDTHATTVGFAEPLPVRAAQLAAEIDRVLVETGREKVHVIGHSMGGLDTRHMLVFVPGMAEKVASLTSIGTPHNGTSFADYGLTHGGEAAIEALREIIDFGGFETLTLAERRAFNEAARHREATNSVVYRVYASAQAREKVFGPLQRPYDIIFAQEGENDGLVSVQSQLWTDRLVADDGTTKPVHQFHFPIPADHLNEIGWWDVRELGRANWWRLNMLREKRGFETAVKNIYLTIAQDVTQL